MSSASAQIEQGRILIQRNRFADAETILRQALAQNPQHSEGQALLALALTFQGKYDAAEQAARQSIHAAPDNSYAHFVLAWVLLDRRRLPDALIAVNEAIRLNPREGRYFRLMARIYLARDEKSPQALDAIRESLRLDPENIESRELYAETLFLHGRHSDARKEARTILSDEPNSAPNHALIGWLAVHDNRIKEAEEAFREALRISPNMRWAQKGLIETLKARNPVYRLILMYFTWMQRLSRETQIGFLFGLTMIARAIIISNRDNLDAARFAIPVLVIFYSFVYVSWTADTLSDLLLRYSRFGRMILPRERIIASNWVALCLLVMLVALGSGLGSSGDTRTMWLVLAAKASLLVIPVSALFRFAKYGYDQSVLYYTLGLVALGLLGLTWDLLGGSAWPLHLAYFVGIVLFTWGMTARSFKDA